MERGWLNPETLLSIPSPGGSPTQGADLRRKLAPRGSLKTPDRTPGETPDLTAVWGMEGLGFWATVVAQNLHPGLGRAQEALAWVRGRALEGGVGFSRLSGKPIVLEGGFAGRERGEGGGGQMTFSADEGLRVAIQDRFL